MRRNTKVSSASLTTGTQSSGAEGAASGLTQLTTGVEDLTNNPSDDDDDDVDMNSQD